MYVNHDYRGMGIRKEHRTGMAYNYSDIDLVLRGRKIKRTVDRIYRELREKYGLKQVEVDVLLYQSMFPEKVSSEIAKEIYIPKGHVSLAMDGLTKKGYVESERDQNDRRFVRFSITEEGRKIVEVIEKLKNEINAGLLDGLTEEEKKQLANICTKLFDNADAIINS